MSTCLDFGAVDPTYAQEAPPTVLSLSKVASGCILSQFIGLFGDTANGMSLPRRQHSGRATRFGEPEDHHRSAIHEVVWFDGMSDLQDRTVPVECPFCAE